MATFIFAFIGLLLIMMGMAIGLAFGQKPIAGSCGGMSAAGMKKACDMCGKVPKDCHKRTAEA